MTRRICFLKHNLPAAPACRPEPRWDCRGAQRPGVRKGAVLGDAGGGVPRAPRGGRAARSRAGRPAVTWRPVLAESPARRRFSRRGGCRERAARDSGGRSAPRETQLSCSSRLQRPSLSSVSHMHAICESLNFLVKSELFLVKFQLNISQKWDLRNLRRVNGQEAE